MGMRISVDLTPYLKVCGNKIIDRVRVKRYCPEHKNAKQADAKFCAHCGKLIISEDVPYKETLSPSDILRNWKEYNSNALYFPEHLDVAIPFETPPNDISVDTEGGDAVELNSLETLQIIDKQISWFKEKYKKEIEFLKQELGENNITVCWGLVAQWL